MARLSVIGILVCTLVPVSAAWGQAIPRPFQGVSVSAVVSQNPGPKLFSYRYRFVNPSVNDGQIRSVQVEITRGSGDAVLPRDSLVNGPGYLQYLSEEVFLEVPMVPVGITGPENWLYGLGYDDQTPPKAFAGWGSADEPYRILPGQSLEGFQLTSPGLPAIRRTEIEPGIDYDNLPSEYGDEAKARELRDSLIFVTATVGPKAPPQTFVPLEFLNYLISLLHQSRANGWVTRDGARDSLLAKLTNAKRKLQDGDNTITRNMLDAFLNEVRASSCQQFTCPGSKPLTSEAYALLFFNGQYLLQRLP